MRNFLPVFLLVGFLSFSVSSTGYFVDGSNSAANDANPGTAVSPLKTIKAGIGKISVAGDSLIVKAGSYGEGAITISNKTGSRAFPIVMTTYGGTDSVTVTLSTSSNGILISGCRFFTIYGFALRNGNPSTIRVQGGSHHVTIEKCDIRYYQLEGIRLGPESYSANQADTCVVRNCYVRGEEPPGTVNSGLAHQKGLWADGVAHLITGNTFCNNWKLNGGSDGAGYQDGSAYTVISHNIFKDNGDDGLDGWHNAGNNIIEYNSAVHNGYNSAGANIGDGRGIKNNGWCGESGYENCGKRNIVRYNIACNNRTAGISDEDAFGECIYYNNTTYNNGSGFPSPSMNSWYFNNVSCDQSATLNNSAPASGNNLQGTVANAATWFVNPAAGDFTPKAGTTQIIDAGAGTIHSYGNWTTITITGFSGAAPDIGAIEYGATSALRGNPNGKYLDDNGFVSPEKVRAEIARVAMFFERGRLQLVCRTADMITPLSIFACDALGRRLIGKQTVSPQLLQRGVSPGYAINSLAGLFIINLESEGQRIAKTLVHTR